MVAADKNALILCVDDYESILAGWKMLLESEGYRVLTSADSSRALQLFVSHPVDEVVLDYQIPGMTGDLVAREMKAIKPTVPILMLSGEYWLPQDKRKLVEAFLFKAESTTVFLTMVKTLLNKGRFMRTTFIALGSGQQGGRGSD